MWEGSLFFTPLPEFITYRYFSDRHSDWYEVVLHCSFDFRFSNNFQWWASVHVPIDHLVVFFGECLFSSSVHFFFFFLGWVVCYWIIWALCIFWKLSPWWSHHLQIFYPGPSLSFHFVYGFPFSTILVDLIRSHLFIFGFISIVLGDCPEKTLIWLCQRMLCLCSLLGVLWCGNSHLSL